MTALPHQLVWQARQIADAHSLRVIPVTDTKIDRKTGTKSQVPAWVVYRRFPQGCNRAGLGDRVKKTRDPERLVEIVRTAAGLSE